MFQSAVQIHEFHVFITIIDDDDGKDDESGKKHFKTGNRRRSK